MPVNHAKEFLKSVHNEALFSHLFSRTLIEVSSVNFKAKFLKMASINSEFLNVSMVEPAPESATTLVSLISMLLRCQSCLVIMHLYKSSKKCLKNKIKICRFDGQTFGNVFCSICKSLQFCQTNSCQRIYLCIIKIKSICIFKAASNIACAVS